MINPAKKQNPLSSPIERQNPVNDPQFANSQGYSVFQLDHNENQTNRYGEVQPLYCFDTVSGDRHVVDYSDSTLANQLDAPLLSEVNVHLDSFAVPKLAIYPHNWAKIIANPLKGDDIPDTALPAFPLYWFATRLFNGFAGSVQVFIPTDLFPDTPSGYVSVDFDDWETVSDSAVNRSLAYSVYMNSMLRLADLFCKGSLLDSLGFSTEIFRFDENVPANVAGIPLPRKLNSYTSHILSQIYEKICAVDNTQILSIIDLDKQPYDGALHLELSYSSRIPFDVSANFDLSVRRDVISQAIRNGHFILFGDATATPDALQWGALKNTLQIALASHLAAPTEISYATPDLSRVAAYQMTIAEFYTTDGIDNIFSSELWMQNIRALMFPRNTATGVSAEPVFMYNGVATEFDYFTIGGVVAAFSDVHSLYSRLLQFYGAFFSIQNSLKYKDLFASARAQPLAVGDVTISVSNNKVSAVDVTRNLLMQRFLNAVNRVKNKLADYMTGIFGIRPTIEAPAPLYISHFQRKLGTSTVVNTAENQGNITTNIADDAGGQARVDAYFDDFMIFITNKYYEGVSSYNNASSPAFFLHDRFEMFNPMLQHIGDEPLDTNLLLTRSDNDHSTFGYTSRYSAYKFAISRNQGGFVDNLPGRVFSYPTSYLDTFANIDSVFIRDRAMFFDQFFKSLTGCSPANYFHFQSSNVIRHTALRKMEYLPPVLF